METGVGAPCRLSLGRIERLHAFSVWLIRLFCFQCVCGVGVCLWGGGHKRLTAYSGNSRCAEMHEGSKKIKRGGGVLLVPGPFLWRNLLLRGPPPGLHAGKRD